MPDPRIPNLTAGNGIGFKVGPQSSVDTMISQGSGATPGTFYLAEDTHRLYIGNDDHTLSPVNEGVRVVSAVSVLNSITDAVPGDFYYCTLENILCVYSGPPSNWVQINPDTYLLANPANITLTPDSSTNSVLVTSTVQDTGGADSPHTSTGNFTIKGGSNVTIGVNTTTREITFSTPSGAKYELVAATQTANESVKLRLHELQSNPAVYSDITLEAGNGGVYPTLSQDGTTITLNGGGFVGSYADFSLSQNASTKELTLTVTDGGNNSKLVKFTPVIKIGNTEQEVKFVYDTTNNANTLTADLNVYTIDEIDAMFASNLQSFEAMYFAGTIGTNGTTPSLTTLKNGKDASNNDLNLRSGATFKFVSEVDAGSVPSGMTIEGFDADGAQIGDMLIITGVEDTNGYISMSASTTKITYIPSGDDTNSFYKPNLSGTRAIQFDKFVDGAATAIAGSDSHKIVFTGDNSNNGYVIVGDSTSTSGSLTTKTITISHKTYTNPTAPTPATANNTGASTDFTAITGLNFDNGHITGYSTTKITLTHNKLDNVTTTAATTGSANSDTGRYNAVQFSQAYTDAQDNTLSGGTMDNNVFGFSSDTLSFSVAQADAGTAPGNAASTKANINIEMVWGSF